MSFVQEHVSDSPNVNAVVAPTMRAARLHEVGGNLEVDMVPRPTPRAAEVLVQVQACGIVQNLRNTLNLANLVPSLVQPPLPAIYGLDVAGVIVETGELVHGFRPGDRVYVNPLRYCGGCRHCRGGKPLGCEALTLNGYLGFWPQSKSMFQDYPGGGLAEYMVAPQYSLVKIPDELSFETAARWGYLGTSYGALRLGQVDMSTSVFINGISGTLGLGAVLFALALGAPRIFGVARNAAVLERVKALAPDRIHVLAIDGSQDVVEWVHSLNDGEGADVVIDALPPRVSAQTFVDGLSVLGRCGRHVNIGGFTGEATIKPIHMTSASQTFIGSCWFTTAQGQEMANLAASKLVDLSIFEHHRFALEDVNQALDVIDNRCGGFSNYVIMPELVRSEG